MPRWEVKIHHKSRYIGFSRIVDAPTGEEAVEQFIKDGFDLRYWNMEVFAYATNGEDFLG